MGILLGLAVAVSGILCGLWLDGGSASSLLQATALLIVMGGTVGAVLVQTPWPVIRQAGVLSRWLLKSPPDATADVIERVVAWAIVARREGYLALESKLNEVSDGFERSGLQMLVDGMDAGDIRAALDVRLAAQEERDRLAAKVFEVAGGYAPTVGILGAVLGLIQVMQHLSEPSQLGAGIAIAFVATIYGVGLANLVLLPLAGRLKGIIRTQVLARELAIDGLAGIASSEHPHVIATRLRGYLKVDGL